jgi:hypothetical protein
MRLSSTGLGKIILEGTLTEMQPEMSGVLMRVQITKPVVWKVRVLLQQNDLRKLLPQLLKTSTVWFFMKYFVGKFIAFKKDVQEEAGI